MDRQFYCNNRLKFSENMMDGELAVFYSGNSLRKTADENYPFFADRNFVYLTGIYQESSILLLSKANGLVEEHLFVLKPDEREEIWSGRRLKEAEVSEISGISNIEYIEMFEKYLHSSIKTGNYFSLWLNLDRLMFTQYADSSHIFAKKIRTNYPYLNLKNAYPNICDQRTIKNAEEIMATRTAMTITNQAIQTMMAKCRPGIMEYQLEAEFNYILSQHGQRSPAFPSIISAGERNFYLHYQELNSRIGDGDLVLADVGAGYSGYCTDISRMFPSNGRFTEMQRNIYEIALEANRAVMDIVKPGMEFTLTNQTCRDVAFKGLKAMGITDDFADISRYVWHGTTHYVGLDVHDVGSYKKTMEKDMIFTVDAGIYVRELGIGLRIEDNVLVTANGCENLSAAIPVTIDDIEVIMGQTKY